MEQNVIQKNMWNTASKAGLVLGLISTAYMFITKWTGQAEMPTFVSMILTGLLWCVKFGGCIWVMMFFMKKFSAENPETDNKGTRKLGMAMALLSNRMLMMICGHPFPPSDPRPHPRKAP